jgi:hypothetical protein
VDVLRAQAHPVHRARREVLHEHVGVADQLLHDLLALRGFGVDRQRALVAVELREVQRVDVGDVAQLTAGDITSVHPLDLEHIGAVPGHHLGARRAGLHPGEVDHLDSAQW